MYRCVFEPVNPMLIIGAHDATLGVMPLVIWVLLMFIMFHVIKVVTHIYIYLLVTLCLGRGM